MRSEQPTMGKTNSGRAHEYDRKNQGTQQLGYRFPEGTYQANA